jgi:hypothetical protein
LNSLNPYRFHSDQLSETTLTKFATVQKSREKDIRQSLGNVVSEVEKEVLVIFESRKATVAGEL